MRTVDYPDDAPYAAPLIDLLTTLHDEAGRWNVMVIRERSTRAVLPDWSIHVTTDNPETGLLAAQAIALTKKEPRDPRVQTWSGTYTDDHGRACSVAVDAPVGDGIVERLRSLVDEADRAGRYPDAELLRVALAEMGDIP